MSLRIAIVVGTRPELVKMASVVRACQTLDAEAILIHTGQHYSFELGEIFFRDLELPPPTYQLAVGSCPDGVQISRMLTGISEILERERPDAVLVQGDTNTALAGGLAANKTGVPLGHVEAGLRSYDRTMPEEVNRRAIDHIADLLFVPTTLARDTLLTEGLEGTRIFLTGNTVVDELERHHARIPQADLLDQYGVTRRKFGIATVHRRENVEDEERLRGIFEGIGAAARELDLPILAALHPRTAKKIEEIGLALDERIRVTPPLGYVDFLGLHMNSTLTLTDSGGLQEEACCLGVPCVTLRDNTERPESVRVGASLLAGARPHYILERAREMIRRPRTWDNPFGDGKSGPRIVEALGLMLQR